MGYTTESVREFLENATTVRDSLTDAIDAAEEYIGSVEDDEADDDDVGLAFQAFEDALEDLTVNGVNLTSSLVEGD